MESKKIVILVVLILLIAGVLAYFYFFREKPAQDFEENYYQINIQAYDGMHRIRTEYELYVNGSLYKQGETLVGGAILERIPIGSSFKVINKNLVNQNFYTQIIEQTTPRVEMKLVKPGQLDVLKNGRLGENVTLTLNAKGENRDLIGCSLWSFSILSVDLNFSQISSTQDRKYDRCWELETLKDSSQNIDLNYRIFGSIGSTDFIKFYIFDRDTIESGLVLKDLKAEVKIT